MEEQGEFEIGDGGVVLAFPERRDFIMAWKFESDSSGVVTALKRKVWMLYPSPKDILQWQLIVKKYMNYILLGVAVGVITDVLFDTALLFFIIFLCETRNILGLVSQLSKEFFDFESGPFGIICEGVEPFTIVSDISCIGD